MRVPVRVGVAGAAGRMGLALVRAVEEAPELTLGALWERPGNARIGTEVGGCVVAAELGTVVADVDVIIDFTSPDALAHHAEVAARAGVALVVGTTGLQPAQHALLDAAARRIPVLQAPNMSVGVNALLALVAQCARYLGDDFDMEIVEAHHKNKRDAPSGTALALLQALQAVRTETTPVFERHGDIGARTRGEIGVQTLRGGDVVGEHTVYFYGAGERIEMTHRATDRAIFATGAVRAARWLASKPAGRYTMSDVLSS